MVEVSPFCCCSYLVFLVFSFKSLSLLTFGLFSLGYFSVCLELFSLLVSGTSSRCLEPRFTWVLESTSALDVIASLESITSSLVSCAGAKMVPSRSSIARLELV